MIIEELDEFKRDVKFLLKKYRSLNQDLTIVKKILAVLPDERPPFSYRINNLGIETCVIKVKKIACKALKGKGVNSGLRLVYAHFKTDNEQASGQKNVNPESIIDDKSSESKATRALDPKIQSTDPITNRIVFIEIYHKNNKTLEDRSRILRYFK